MATLKTRTIYRLLVNFDHALSIRSAVFVITAQPLEPSVTGNVGQRLAQAEIVLLQPFGSLCALDHCKRLDPCLATPVAPISGWMSFRCRLLFSNRLNGWWSAL
jgi:hypothetical protein